MRVRLGLMRGKFVVALAAVPIDLLPWMSLWLGTQMKVTESGVEERVVKREWTRVIRGWRECALETADKAGTESVMIRKD